MKFNKEIKAISIQSIVYYPRINYNQKGKRIFHTQFKGLKIVKRASVSVARFSSLCLPID